VAFAVIANGQVIWTHGIGVKSTATGEPVTSDTVFQVGSLGKPVFAYAVLRLVEAGQLDLDRPLDDELPAPYIPDEPRARGITARHILCHTTGLPNWRFEAEDVLSVGFTPGERFQYSGEGYFYLQRVVEELSGQPFESFMQEQVLRPLGMRRSTYLWSADHERWMASGHRGGEPAESWNAWQGSRMLALAAVVGKPLPMWRYDDIVRALPAIHPDLAPLPNNLIPNAAGSLLTTSMEYAQFVLRCMDRETRDTYDLQADTRWQMLTPQVSLNRALAWGLGWGLERDAASVRFWHWGDTGLFQSFVAGGPRAGDGVVVLTNSDRGQKICERVVRCVTGREHDAFLWL
jgi:CubicO group peptidase (beta-lactamase class C family)